jgi:Golgi phosphoprotein 3 (GPP34)
METLTLADELALLAYDDGGSTDLGPPTLDYGLAGAVLIELALAERVAVADDRLVVTDATPLGHPVLDAALAQIAADEKRRKPKDWVSKLSKDLRDRVLDGLAARGILERVKDKVMWIFPRTRYPSRHGVEPPAETAARQRLVAAVNADGPVDARTAALCALVRAVKYDKKVFADLPRDRVKSRLTEISEGDWAAAAVKKAVEEMEAAIMVAVMVPTMTVATNN